MSFWQKWKVNMSERYYTESDIKDFETIESKDSAMILKELKSLREEVYKLRGTIPEKSASQKKDDILSIKDTSKRLQAIRENMDLFRQEK